MRHIADGFILLIINDVDEVDNVNAFASIRSKS